MNGTASRADRIRDWFYYAHQRGMLMHCNHVFVWCLIDNIAHEWFRVPLAGEDEPEPWICRKHDRAAYRGHIRHEHRERARRIRKLGWGR